MRKKMMHTLVLAGLMGMGAFALVGCNGESGDDNLEDAAENLEDAAEDAADAADEAMDDAAEAIDDTVDDSSGGI